MPNSELPARFRIHAAPRVGLLLLAIAPVFCLTSYGGGNSALLAQAEEALDRGDRDTAIAAFRTYLERVPDASETRLKLGSLLRESEPREALQVLEKVPVSDPHRLAAVQQIAIIQIVAGRSTEAESALKEVIVAQPENFGAQLSLAELYFRMGAFKSALPHAIEARRLRPDRAQTCLLLAEIHDELHDPASMIEPLRSALQIDPDFYAAHLNLAYAAHKTGDLTTASNEANWCLARQPRDVAALRILAAVARDDGRFTEAQSRLDKALAIAPHDLDCRILEADLLLYKRQPRQAYDRLKEIYDANKETVRYLGALARSAASAGLREESKALHRRISERVEKPAASKERDSAENVDTTPAPGGSPVAP